MTRLTLLSQPNEKAGPREGTGLSFVVLAGKTNIPGRHTALAHGGNLRKFNFTCHAAYYAGVVPGVKVVDRASTD